MTDKGERDLIVGTISDIEDSVEDLDVRIEALIEEVNAKRERLKAWQAKLAEIDAPGVHHGRRPRGENLRAIKACLENAIEGLSASEVKTKTGLAWSSVQRVLSQNPSLFVEINNLWKIRRTPKVGVVAATNGVAKESEV